MLYQLNTDKRQDEPNTADDNDARVDDGNDKRFHSHTRITKHDKTCVLRSTVEHNDASGHLNLSEKKKKNAAERPFNGRDGCEEKKSKTPKKTKTHRHRLMRCRHSKLPPAGISRRSSLAEPPESAHDFWLVCSGIGQAQRAEIIAFRSASGRGSSRRGCVVQHHQLRYDQGTRDSLNLPTQHEQQCEKNQLRVEETTHQKLVDRLLHVTAQDMISFRNPVRSDEQTERVLAVYDSFKPIRHATKTIHPREHGHTGTAATTRPCPRAYTRPRAHARSLR